MTKKQRKHNRKILWNRLKLTVKAIFSKEAKKKLMYNDYMRDYMKDYKRGIRRENTSKI
jgi:hypothetical protein